MKKLAKRNKKKSHTVSFKSKHKQHENYTNQYK